MEGTTHGVDIDFFPYSPFSLLDHLLLFAPNLLRTLSIFIPVLIKSRSFPVANENLESHVKLNEKKHDNKSWRFSKVGGDAFTGSHVAPMLVRQSNHWHAAPSAQNRLWHLLTSALDISETMLPIHYIALT